MQFKLSKYIIPSVISMVLVGTYTNIDGFFIGNAVGDDGLAAINIVWPIVAFITSAGTGIGVGGSVIMNGMRGEDKHDEAENIKKTTVLLLAAVGIFISLVMFVTYKPLLRLMGAEGAVLNHAQSYAAVISSCAVFQIMGSGLVVILRNEGRTYPAMLYTVAGLVIHILLDALLVNKYSLYGVAVSTVVSQAAIMLLCIFSLKVKSNAKIIMNSAASVLKASTAPFGVNFVSSLVLLFTNYAALKTGGTAAVSAYAVMSYAVYTFDYIFQGVCDGIQPAVSYYSGAGNKAGEKKTLFCAVGVLLAFAVCFAALTPALIAVLPKLFAVSDKAEQIMKSGLKIYAVSYVFKAAVKLICSYYYACRQFKLSNILTYIDPVLLTPVFLLILPHFFGINGIWLTMTLAQIAVTAVGAAGAVLQRKRENIKVKL